MSVLPNVPYDLIVKINALITNFLWDGRRPKIPLSILQLPREQGGLRLVNLFEKQMLLKVQWVILMNKDPFWSQVAYNCLDCVINESIWKCNLHCDDVDDAIHKNTFWRQVLYAWCRYNYQDKLAPYEIYHTIIWFNSDIKIDGHVLMSHNAWRAGLYYVGQLFDENGHTLTYEALVDKYGHVISWFQHFQLIKAVPNEWKNIIRINRNIPRLPCVSKYDRILTKDKISAVVYLCLIDDDNKALVKKTKWENRLQINIEKNTFLEYFQNITMLTNFTKFRDFQFRLLHNVIITNQKLHLWKMMDTNVCTFCETHVETLSHLFWYCNEVQKLWNDIDLYVRSKASDNETRFLEWNCETVMFNTVHFKSKQKINFVVLIAKQYVYRQRCAKRKIYSNLFLREIDNKQQIEYDIVKFKGKLRNHYVKWSTLDRSLVQTMREIENEHSYINMYLANI